MSAPDDAIIQERKEMHNQEETSSITTDPVEIERIERIANVVAALGMRLGGMDERIVPTLVYLVQRRGYELHAVALVPGDAAATPDGPVNLLARGLLRTRQRPSCWGRYVHMEGPDGTRTVRAVANRVPDDLGHMSVAIDRLVREIAIAFGERSVDELRTMFAESPTMTECRPTKIETPIPPLAIMEAVGIERNVAEEVLAENQSLEDAMARIMRFRP